MGGRVVATGVAADIAPTWLQTPFSGVQRHQRRMGKICTLECQARQGKA
jgi:ribose 5-phosphate isomerase RpiB